MKLVGGSNGVKAIRNWLIALAIVASAGGVMLTSATPQVALAADQCKPGNFLGFPPWYRGLTDTTAECNIIGPAKTKNGLSNFIWTIGLNVLDMALVLIAYLSGFIFLYGGWLFILSQGKPEGIAKGKSTMTMALIGLVTSVVAVALINFIFAEVF
jgi:hypothetical protein